MEERREEKNKKRKKRRKRLRQSIDPELHISCTPREAPREREA